MICSRLFHISRALTNGAYKRDAPVLRGASASVQDTRSKHSAFQNLAEESVGYCKPKLISGISGIPKDLQLVRHNPYQFGDDACFTASHPKGDVLGVADGVGGWRQYGVDPGVFSSALMRACERLATAGAFSAGRPDRLLSDAFAELMDSKRPVVGSSTACVLALCRDSGRLHAANIGDSAFMVVRGGRLVVRSEEQQHYFNTPYQLANAPPGRDRQVLSDAPESAVSSETAVQQGDIILLGSDGVFDNVPDHLLLQQLASLHGCREDSQLQQAANTIALMARTLAADSTSMSPFARNARAHGYDAVGGKPDDITVILASVIT